MGFVKAKIEIGNPLIGTGIKVSLKKVRTSASKFNVYVTGAAMKDLGWKAGDKLEVLLGDGADHGMIRFRKNNSVGEASVVERNAVRGGKYLLVALGNQPAFVDRAEPARWCQWELVDDGWCEVVLPKWADETAPRKPASTASGVVKAVAAPVAKQPVTAQLMGDPPPGRREMLKTMGDMKV